MLFIWQCVIQSIVSIRLISKYWCLCKRSDWLGFKEKLLLLIVCCFLSFSSLLHLQWEQPSCSDCNFLCCGHHPAHCVALCPDWQVSPLVTWLDHGIFPPFAVSLYLKFDCPAAWNPTFSCIFFTFIAVKDTITAVFRCTCIYRRKLRIACACMCVRVCGWSWQSVPFRESINPQLIIRLTDPLLAYKSWDNTHTCTYTHAHTHARTQLSLASRLGQRVRSYWEMWHYLWPFCVWIGRFCCHSKSKHPDEKRLHFGNGHRKYRAIFPEAQFDLYSLRFAVHWVKI